MDYYAEDMSNYAEFNIAELLQLGDAESIRMVYELSKLLFHQVLPI